MMNPKNPAKIANRLAAAGLVAGILPLMVLPSLAQQQGSIGMDEMDASLSAESGDVADARAQSDAALARMQESNQALNDRMDDLEQRLQAVEQQVQPE